MSTKPIHLKGTAITLNGSFSDTPSALAGTNSVAKKHINKIGGEIITTIELNLKGMSINKPASGDDNSKLYVIAKLNEANAHITQIKVDNSDDNNGNIYKTEITCLEPISTGSSAGIQNLAFIYSSKSNLSESDNGTDNSTSNFGFLDITDSGGSENAKTSYIYGDNNTTTANYLKYYKYNTSNFVFEPISINGKVGSLGSSPNYDITLSANDGFGGSFTYTDLKLGHILVCSSDPNLISRNPYITNIVSGSEPIITLSVGQSTLSNENLDFNNVNLKDLYIYIVGKKSNMASSGDTELTAGKFIIKLYGNGTV